MAKHDILTYNSASKGFETALNDNTAQIKGDGTKIFSIESGSDTLLSVGTSNTSIVFNSNITSSGNISSSLASTASFGRLEFTKISGDASQMTNVNEVGHVSGAAQLATRISGAFDSGFTTIGDISGSRTSSGSFGRVFAAKYVGDASQMTNTNESGHFSGSAQLATQISGAFTSGFNYDGKISGSATSTGSFGRVNWDGQITGDASAVTNLNESGFISSSGQIATEISGAFNKGFEFTGLTREQILTSSYVGVSGSAFAYAGNATTMSISSICGSDFDYRIYYSQSIAGRIQGKSIGNGSWSAGPNRNDDQSGFASVGTQNAYLSAGGYKENKDGTEKFDGTSFSFSANMSVENNALSGFGTQNAAAFMGGFGDFDGTELYNGATYSDGANMTQDRRYAGTAGTQNAGIIFAGTGASPYPNRGESETFDGNVWTEVADLNLARGLLASAGTQNSAIGAAGLVSPASKTETELWNGTSWTETADMIVGRHGAAGIGTQNHFIVAAGYASTPNAFSANTEEWNGTSWSEVNNLGTARGSFAGSQGGLGSAGIVAGGQIGSPTATNTVELWNDNSTSGSFGKVVFAGKISGDASQVTNLTLTTGTVSGSAQLASQISGSFRSGILYDGTISGSMQSTASFFNVSASTYNLSSVPDINTPLQQVVGAVSSSGQLVNSVGSSYISGAFNYGFEFSGTISGSRTSTGSFTRADAIELVGDGSDIADITLPTGVVSGSAQLASRISGAFTSGFEFTGLTREQILTASYVGVSGSAFAYAGNATTMSISSICGSDFEYRIYHSQSLGGRIKGMSMGTGVWSAGAARTAVMSSGFNIGTQNSALSVGGYSPGIVADAYKYSGDSWAASAPLIAGKAAGGSSGTQNAALVFGGLTGVPNTCTNTTEAYNGATFSEQNNLPAALRNTAGTGTQNATVQTGHYIAPATFNTETYLFDGTSWSDAGADSITMRRDVGFGGTYNAAITAGGAKSPYAASKCVENWNGASWSGGTAIIVSRTGASFAGTQNAGILFGNAAPYSGITEEWNGTSWSERNDLIQQRGYIGCTGAGVSDAAAAFGGFNNPSFLNNTEFWNDNSTSGSFGLLIADSWNVDNIDDVTYSFPSATCTAANLATQISGSFNKGFGFNGKISGSVKSTGSLTEFKSDTVVTKNMEIGGEVSASFRSFTNKPHIIPYVGDAYYDSRQYLPTSSGQLYSCGSCTEFSNGYNSADGQLSIGRDGILNISFQTASAADDGNGITAGVWSAGPDMITGTRGQFFGQQNASVMVSGNTTQGEGPTTSHTQHYNGLSWRRGADILNAVGAVGGGQGYGHGEDDVGILKSYTNGPINKHQQYGGFSWWHMTVNNVNGRNNGAAGTQNAAVMYGGATSPFKQTEEWNGHAWNVAGAMSSGRYARVGAGSQNATIAGGGVPAPAIHVATEFYNGTTWSNGPNTPYSGADCKAGMSGTQNDALARGGSEKAGTWDGTAWSSTIDLPNARDKADVSGNSAVGMVAGGGPTPGASVTTTLEWNNSFNTGSYLLTKKIESNFS